MKDDDGSKANQMFMDECILLSSLYVDTSIGMVHLSVESNCLVV